MVYFSASDTRLAFRKGEPAGYSGITMPPGRMAWGWYGPLVTGPALGTICGAGVDCASADVATAAANRPVMMNLRIWLPKPVLVGRSMEQDLGI